MRKASSIFSPNRQRSRAEKWWATNIWTSLVCNLLISLSLSVCVSFLDSCFCLLLCIRDSVFGSGLTRRRWGGCREEKTRRESQTEFIGYIFNLVTGVHTMQHFYCRNSSIKRVCLILYWHSIAEKKFKLFLSGSLFFRDWPFIFLSNSKIV